ncbi:hypothetical protein [Thermoflexus sp.]|uniref:hypothetical protein n=1 Tax=Thermoflexus sp. TaxID=1969742 RepID=UPI002ADDCB6F|nr:hypothetical protein [Thermoflexus sp.]
MLGIHSRHLWWLRLILAWGFFLWLLDLAVRDPRSIPLSASFFLTWIVAWLVDSAARLSIPSDREPPWLLTALNTLVISIMAWINTSWASLGIRDGMLWLFAGLYPFSQPSPWIRAWKDLQGIWSARSLEERP